MHRRIYAHDAPLNTRPMNHPIIQFERVSFTYVDDRSSDPRSSTFELTLPELTLRPGECVACIGPSGSGKTTLLNLIAGLLTPGSGRLCVLGHELRGLGERDLRKLRLGSMALVFQELELVEYLSAIDNILLVADLARTSSSPPRSALMPRAIQLASACGIGGLLSRKPRRLSQGERQRVAICRALLLNPPLILCDEPTGNLDPHTTNTVLELLLDHARAHQSGLIMVTHNHGLLGRFDRVIDLGCHQKNPGQGGHA